MTKYDFSSPQRKNVLAILVSIVFSMQGILRALFPVLLIFFFKDTEGISFLWGLIGLAVFFLLLAIHGYLSWRNFYFYIKDDEFILEKGYLKKKIVALPLAKIVSVHTSQKLLHQLLGVVEVEVDSVGTDKKEVKLDAVKKDFALALEEALSTANSKDVQAEAQVQPDNETEKAPTKKVIIAHSLGHIFKIGVSRNHLQGLLLVALFVYQFVGDFRDLFKEQIDSAINETTTSLENSDVFIWTSLGICLILFSIVFSIVRTFLFYYDLKLLQIKKTFLLQFGLLKRKKMSVPFSRIQALVYSANPLQRLLKITTTELIQTSNKIIDKDNEKVMILGCSKEQKEQIQSIILPQLKELVSFVPSSSIRIRYFMLGSVVFAFPFLFVAYFYSWCWLWAFVVMEVALGCYAHYSYKSICYEFDGDLLQIKKGWITQTKTLLEPYKIQSVKLSQSFFQRKKNTATLHLHLSGTCVRLSYIPLKSAEDLRDFLLYGAVKTQKNWM